MPPGDGSIVERKSGSISCQNIKNVATACAGVAPNSNGWWGHGPAFYASWDYYYFDGATKETWPYNDPCGARGNNNYKKGVNNPGGQIYVR